VQSTSRIKIIPPGYGQPPPPFVDTIPIPKTNNFLVVNITSSVTFDDQLIEYQNRGIKTMDNKKSHIGLIIGMGILTMVIGTIIGVVIVVVLVTLKVRNDRTKYSSV